jgi:hypothetical protein
MACCSLLCRCACETCAGTRAWQVRLFNLEVVKRMRDLDPEDIDSLVRCSWQSLSALTDGVASTTLLRIALCLRVFDALSLSPSLCL